MEIELIEKPEAALTVAARAALALSFEQTRKDLQELVAKSANIKEVKNTAGREECHGAAMALVRARTTITKTGKAAREDAAAFQKAVIAEEKALIAITEPEENRLLGLRDAWDAARAAEKAEAERIERERVAAIHARIGQIKAFGTLALECRTAAKVDELLVKLNDGAHCTPSFEEFEEEGIKALTDTRARMVEIRDAKLAEEQERARVAAEQEAERQRLAAERAEQEAKAKAARDADEAAARAVRDAEELRLAEQRAELDRQRAEFQAEVDRRAAEAKALETVVTEIQPEEVEATGPAPLAATDTDPFQQMDGSDELDGPQEPSDADIIACAATAVADKFGIPFNEALNRLAEVQKWIPVEVAV